MLGCDTQNITRDRLQKGIQGDTGHDGCERDARVRVSGGCDGATPWGSDGTGAVSGAVRKAPCPEGVTHNRGSRSGRWAKAAGVQGGRVQTRNDRPSRCFPACGR
eukprot:1193859-Prorocentrum_minimum.AAC.2